MNKTAYRILCLAAALMLAFGASFSAMASGESRPAMQGKIYYVSTSGNDSNPGTNASPFKTFAKAVSVLAPGDTLQVMPGTFYESLRLTKSGTAEAPIDVIGNGAVLNMRGIETTGIKISGSYVNLSNFEVTGATDAGIAIPGKNVTVKNSILYGNVTQNGVNGKCGVAGSYSSALKVGVGGKSIIIEGNTIYRNCGEGIAITRGIYVVVKNNTVYDNFAPNIYIDNSPYVRVQGNLVYCTGAVLRRDGTRPTAIGLGEEYYEGWGARMHDVVVSTNTIRDCGKGIGAFDSEVGGTLTNITITKNYIPSGDGRAIAFTNEANKNVVISYNTLFNEPWLEHPAGISLIGNTITGAKSYSCSPQSAYTGAKVAKAAAGGLTISSIDTAAFSVADSTDEDSAGVFRPSNGKIFLKNENTTGTADVAIEYGLAGDCPLVGDWNGDGIDTIGIYRNGVFYLRNSNETGVADVAFAFGAPGDQPISGDWDGDGVDTIGVYRSSKIAFYLRNSNSPGDPDLSFKLGSPGDVAISGDWDGDGKDTTGVFRPSNGKIYLKDGNSTGFADVAFVYGVAGDQPVAGDWNNDGLDTIGIYRNGKFYLRNSNTVGFADVVFALGNPGDLPIAGNWDGAP